MPAIAVTGGIACGKSTVWSSLLAVLRKNHFDAAGFCADSFSHQLLASDKDVRSRILGDFGQEATAPDGSICRASLRKVVTDRPEKRKQLERILHPIIREAWTHQAEIARTSRSWFVAEIPLLFESDVQHLFDKVVTVACSTATQMQRLLARAWTQKQIQEILIAQTPTEVKILGAHHVIWTDVPKHIVGRQTALLAKSLLNTFAG